MKPILNGGYMTEKDIQLLKEVWGTLFENRYDLTEDGDEFDVDFLLGSFSSLISRIESEVEGNE